MVDILCAVGLDLALGDPAWLPHPVRLMGRLIAFEERLVRQFARDRRSLYFGGACIVVLNVILACSLPFLLLNMLRPYPLFYHSVNVYLLYTCLAARCLRDEALKVLRALERGLDQARNQLSFIVGRDTARLDESDIVRATVETVAENTSDGVIAPLVWAMLGGAPLALMYKMMNTMDSMLGYMNEKYRYIGFLSARTDDVVNFFPARLTGALMILGSMFRFQVRDGFRVMSRDRHQHKSPNCAYPEGAVAGLLGIQLGGANSYFGEIIHKPTIGDACRPPARQDISHAIEIMFRAEGILILMYILFVFLCHLMWG